MPAEIRLAVWATGENEAPELGLKPENIRAEVDNSPVEVKSVRGPGSSLILLVVMDLVGDPGSIDAARRRLDQHFQDMGPEQYVALMQAQDGLSVVQDPTRDREKLSQTLAEMPTAAYPGLLDAVEEAALIGQSMLEGSKVRVAVLFITDGGIQDYRGDYTNPVVNRSDSRDLSRRFRDRVIQEKISAIDARLSAISTPLFFLHLDEADDALNVAYQNGISQFAATTGGRAAYSRGIAEIPTLLEGLLARIDEHYSVTLETPAVAEGRLEVRLDAGSRAELEHREVLEVTP